MKSSHSIRMSLASGHRGRALQTEKKLREDFSNYKGIRQNQAVNQPRRPTDRPKSKTIQPKRSTIQPKSEMIQPTPNKSAKNGDNSAKTINNSAEIGDDTANAQQIGKKWG